MKRRTFDKLVSYVGLGLAALLLTFAGLLNWGASFADLFLLLGIAGLMHIRRTPEDATI
jgi:hypothetical protein